MPGVPAGAICMELALPSPLGPGKELDLAFVGVYVGQLAPFPATAPAGSPLRVLFKADAAVLVPYPVQKQSIKARMGRGGRATWGAGGPALPPCICRRRGVHRLWSCTTACCPPLPAAPCRAQAKCARAMPMFSMSRCRWISAVCWT